jgi:hypothetical protein
MDLLFVSVVLALWRRSYAAPTCITFAKTNEAFDQTASMLASKQICSPDPREPLSELVAKLVDVGSEAPITPPEFHAPAGARVGHLEF